MAQVQERDVGRLIKSCRARVRWLGSNPVPSVSHSSRLPRWCSHPDGNRPEGRLRKDVIRPQRRNLRSLLRPRKRKRSQKRRRRGPPKKSKKNAVEEKQDLPS